MNLRTTLILLLVFLALGAYFVFVERNRPSEQEREMIEKSVMQFNRVAIESFELSHGEGDIRCVKTGEGWEMRRPVEAECDEGTVASVLSSLASLQTTRFIPADSTSLDQFGLGEPSIRVSVASSAPPDSHWIMIGDETPAGDAYYSIADRRDRIALIPASTVNSNFKMSAFDLRDKTVLDFEVGQTTAMELHYNGAKIRCERLRDRPWEITEPVRAMGDDTEINSVLWDIENAKVREFLDEEPVDLSVYGLEKPAVTAKVFIGAGKTMRKLEFGAEAEEGGVVYARRTGYDDIVKVDKRLMEKVQTDLVDLRMKRLMSFATSDVASIDIFMGDSTFSCVMDSAGEWSTAEPKSRPLKKWKMNGVSSQLSFLRAFSFIDDPDADLDAMGLTAPRLKIVVTLNDSTTAELDLGTVEEDELFVRADGQIAKVSEGFLNDMTGIVRHPPYTEEGAPDEQPE